MMYYLFAALCIAALATEACALNAKDFGAVGNGTTDDSAAIQKALDAARADRGGIVELGTGRFRLDNPIKVPEGVTLKGVWEAPHHAQLKSGTVIEVYAGKGNEAAPAAISLAPSSAVKGITFFYPEQRIPGTIAYPFTISGYGMHNSVIDCTFVNPYKAIDFGTRPNELHYIRNVFGCPLKLGVFIDKCTDIGRIENVHFNPHYWGRAEVEGIPGWPELITYLAENFTAFEFARTDWEYVHNTFVFGAKVGYHFRSDKDGAANGNFLGIGADMCGAALLVDECQMPGLLITNGEFVAGEKAPSMIVISPTNTGVVQFSNCSFWGPCPAIAIIDGKGTVTMNQCAFLNWGKNKEAYAIDARAGDVTIQTCRFGVDKPDIKLGENIRTAVIMGNRFTGKEEIDNRSKGDVQKGLNVVAR